VPPIPLARPVVTVPPLPTDRSREILLLDLPPRQAWADLTWLLLGLALVELLLGGVLYAVAAACYDTPLEHAKDADPSVRRALLAWNLSLRAGGWLFVVTLLCRRRGLGFAAVGLNRKGRLADVGLGLVSVVAVYTFMFAALVPLQLAFPEIRRQFEQNATEITGNLPRLCLYQFGLVAMAVGVYEEVLFRGFMMPRLRRATGSWTAAVFLSSVLFTVLHMFDQKPAAMILIGFLSLAFSVVTVLRRSLLPAIVAHALFDFSQFVGIYLTAGDRWK
jgi:membrane protease YdiL (CAAX protease family)